MSHSQIFDPPLSPKDPIPAAKMNEIDTKIQASLDIAGSNTVSGAITLSTGRYGYASQSVTRRQLGTVVAQTGWAQGSIPTTYVQQTAANNIVELELDRIPDGSTLNTVTITLIGAGGHAGLPTLPTLAVYRIAGNVQTQIGSTTTDGSGDTTAYQTAHNISVSSLSHTVDRAANIYVCRVTGEAGGNFVLGAQIYDLVATFTVTNQDNGG